MRIRAMIAEDGEETLRLFCDTVRGVCAEDYTPRQIEAWIGKRDVGAWTQSFFGNRRALVAEENGKIVGFADMTDGGYFDRLYVHREYQRRGIAAGRFLWSLVWGGGTPRPGARAGARRRIGRGKCGARFYGRRVADGARFF